MPGVPPTQRRSLASVWIVSWRGAAHVPRAAQRLLVEELDPAQGDRVRPARHLPHGGQVHQVVAHLLFPDPVGGGTMELRELCDGPDVGLDGAIRIAAQLKVLNHTLAERCHDVLSGKR